MEKRDVLIVGAGPCGLSCGIEAKKRGLSYLVLEKGGITDAIRRFPTAMTFFSTPELLELDGLPFTTERMRPSRAEALQYYRKVADFHGLDIRLYTAVTALRGSAGDFELESQDGEHFAARNVVLALGYFDRANRLGIPGEDLPHVSHYYTEPHGFARMRVAVVGGGNSAVEAALELYRAGARVTVVHRQAAVKDSVKYWIRPDFENRVKLGGIRALFRHEAREIRPGSLRLRDLDAEKDRELEADFVLVLTGYRPDVEFLMAAGVGVDPQSLIPEHDASSMETNVKGLYLAGSVACGCETGTIFIENGRAHARPIMDRIAAGRGRP